MSKKTHDHKQLRALEKQRRIDRVSHKDEPGLSIRVPKLCRESLLYDLSRDFYRLTGVDIFIGIPANIQDRDGECGCWAGSYLGWRPDVSTICCLL